MGPVAAVQTPQLSARGGTAGHGLCSSNSHGLHVPQELGWAWCLMELPNPYEAGSAAAAVLLALLGACAVTLMACAQRGWCSMAQCCMHLPAGAACRVCSAGRPSLLRGCLGEGVEGYGCGHLSVDKDSSGGCPAVLMQIRVYMQIVVLDVV